MIRYTRQDMPDLPRPVYELTAERIGWDVRVAVMVGGGQVCSMEEFPLIEEDGECIGLSAWPRTLAYAGSDDATWRVASRAFSHRIRERLLTTRPLDEPSRLARAVD